MNNSYYLISAAGIQNFGDDLITKTWIETIRSKQPTAKIYLDCIDPVCAQSLFADVEVVDYLWKFAEWYDRDSPLDVIQEFNYCLNPVNHGRSGRARLLEKTLNEVSTVHILGGGYLNSIWRKNLNILYFLAMLKKKLCFRLFATGVGLLPLEEKDRSAVKCAVNAFDVFDVRDEHSFVEIEGCQSAVFSGDDIKLSAYRPRVEQNGSKSINLCIADEFFETPDHKTKVWSKILETVLLHFKEGAYETIRYFEFREGSDINFLKLLSSFALPIEFVSYEDLWKNNYYVSKQDLFVSSRFHFQYIFAREIEFGVTLYWSDYYEYKLNSVNKASGWVNLAIKDSALKNIDLTQLPGSEQHNSATFTSSKEDIVRRIYHS